MKVTIFGAGNMGRGIGTRVVAGGNDLQVLDAESEKADELVEELRGRTTDGASVERGDPGDPLTGEVVVLALPYEAALSVVQEYAGQLEGKVVIDITNPVDFESFDRLVTPDDSSAAEEIGKKAPPGAKVVKAFNTTFAGTLVDGEVGGQPLDVFIAGDDEGAKGSVVELVEAGGLNAIDTGSLKRARELERLGFLHMAMQSTLGTGFGSAVKIIT